MPREVDRSFLTPLVGAPKRSRFGTWDLESKDGRSQRKGFTRVFLAGFYDGANYYPSFDQGDGGDWRTRAYRPGGSVDRMLRFMLSECYRGWTFYAHNAGAFDFLHLLPSLVRMKKERDLQVSLVPVGPSSLLAVDVWKTDKKWQRWRFVDSVRLLPMALSQAAQAFGAGEKYKDRDGTQILDRNGDPFTLDCPEDDPGWIPYNRRDLEMLYDTLVRVHELVETEFHGEVGLTAPSTSMKTFRRGFLRESIPREMHTHAFIRESYVGGRCEAIYEHGEGLADFDINSSYVHQMTLDMPAGTAREWSNGEPPAEWRRSRVGFVECVVRVPDDMPIPPLPVKARGRDFPDGAGVDGKLVFPTGVLSGIWEWGELENAIACGCDVVEWRKSVWYETKPFLREFVETLYRYRDQARCFSCAGSLGEAFWCPRCGKPGYDQGLDAFAKLLGNAHYGKYGQHPTRLKFWWVTDPDMPEGCTPLVEDDPDCQVWIKEEESDASFIIPQISARVTALGRVHLHRFAMKALGRILRKCQGCRSSVTFESRRPRGVRGGLEWTAKASTDLCGAECGGVGRHGDPTAAIRIRARDARCPCGGALETRWGRVFYMDTDSIKTDVRMPTGTELGEWKDEVPRFSGFLEGRFYGPKLYSLSVDGSYGLQPEEIRRAMMERDRKFVAKLLDEAAKAGVTPQEKSREALSGKVGVGKGGEREKDWSLVKAKGMGKERKTAENLEILYRGALERLRWLGDPSNRRPDGSPRPMPEAVKKAGTIVEERLEKLGTLARLVKRNPDGTPKLRQLPDGRFARQSDPFGRGPLMRPTPKRLHLEGAKRVHAGDGTTTPYHVNMVKRRGAVN